MPGAVYLEGETVTLRTIEEDDLPFLRDLVNDPAVRHFLGNRGPLNLSQERDFFEGIVSDDGTVTLLICADAEPVGTIGLYPRSAVDGGSEISVFVDQDHWGRGYGSEASALLVDYGFRECRLHRIVAKVVDGNEASRRIWEGLGFRHEATLREARFQRGDFVDEHVYAVLEDEWSND